MKLKILGSVLLVLSIAVFLRAQTPSTPLAGLETVVGAHSTCPLSTAVPTLYCLATDGVYVSIGGAAFVSVTPATSGTVVSSVTVCNAAGTTCQNAQSGPVTLKIPSSASTTITVQSPPLALSGGSLSVGAPTATAVTSVQ